MIRSRRSFRASLLSFLIYLLALGLWWDLGRGPQSFLGALSPRSAAASAPRGAPAPLERRPAAEARVLDRRLPR